MEYPLEICLSYVFVIVFSVVLKFPEESLEKFLCWMFFFALVSQVLSFYSLHISFFSPVISRDQCPQREQQTFPQDWEYYAILWSILWRYVCHTCLSLFFQLFWSFRKSLWKSFCAGCFFLPWSARSSHFIVFTFRSSLPSFQEISAHKENNKHVLKIGNTMRYYGVSSGDMFVIRVCHCFFQLFWSFRKSLWKSFCAGCFFLPWSARSSHFIVFTFRSSLPSFQEISTPKENNKHVLKIGNTMQYYGVSSGDMFVIRVCHCFFPLFWSFRKSLWKSFCAGCFFLPWLARSSHFIVFTFRSSLPSFQEISAHKENNKHVLKIGNTMQYYGVSSGDMFVIRVCHCFFQLFWSFRKSLWKSFCAGCFFLPWSARSSHFIVFTFRSSLPSFQEISTPKENNKHVLKIGNTMQYYGVSSGDMFVIRVCHCFFQLFWSFRKSLWKSFCAGCFFCLG